MARLRWKDLEPWRPFFWSGRLPTGVYLKAERRPVLLPLGHEVDAEIYFAIRLVPDIKEGFLRLHRYAFMKNPEKHTQRSVHREGYWHFGMRVATSSSQAVIILKDFMQAYESLLFSQNVSQTSFIEADEEKRVNSSKTYNEATLNRLVAWTERMQ